VTPFTLVRWLGPAGMALARTLGRWRMARLEMHPTAHVARAPDGDLIAAYIIGGACAWAPSSEGVLSHVLAPGAWGRRALAPRLTHALLSGALPAHLALGFIYGGDKDWMDNKAAAPVLEAAERAGRTVRLHIDQHSGHQIGIENPRAVADFILHVAHDAHKKG
jgi:hypothetical protein